MDRFIVGMAVGALAVAHINSPYSKVVMGVIHCPWGDLLQKLFHIGDKQGFRLIHDHGHGRVQALNIYNAFFNAGYFYLFLDLFRNIDKIKSGGCF